jgi:hypothetical protein
VNPNSNSNQYGLELSRILILLLSMRACNVHDSKYGVASDSRSVAMYVSRRRYGLGPRTGDDSIIV